MKEWYHTVFQVSFGILILQNLLIPLSLTMDSVELVFPYYLDLIGFGLLGIISLYYFITHRDIFGIFSSIFLLIWVGLRCYFQFIITESFDLNQTSTEFFGQIELVLSQAGLFIFLGALVLFNYGLLLQFSAKSNTSLLLLFVVMNLLASFMIFFAFYISGVTTVEAQIEKSSLGLVLKIFVVPLLAIFAFGSMLSNTQKIYPSTVKS